MYLEWKLIGTWFHFEIVEVELFNFYVNKSLINFSF